MPTALTGGRPALPPSVPTPLVPTLPIDTASKGSTSAASTPYERAARLPPLPHFYGLTYYHQRLRSLGLTQQQAQTYGLDVDEHGHILQLVRRFDGSYIKFVPLQFRKKVDRLLRHRSNYQPHLEMYDRLLAVTRYHPDYLKENPTRPKYGNQFGEQVRPPPAPRATKAYNAGITGGLIAFIEGYFKAIALDRAGIESVAFTGITVYRICPALREYLLLRRPDRILIMYDNDALDVSSSSPTQAPRTATSPLPSAAVRGGAGGEVHERSEQKCLGHLSSRRNEDFANSARKFATALFSLFSSINHQCEIVFVMGRPGTEEKGVDDLITTHGTAAVTQDLLNFPFSPTFRESRFFAGFTLFKSTCSRKLNRLFLGDNYRHWRERLTNGPRAQRAATSNESTPFIYRGATYQPIDTGNLYDETITYQLTTDPFAVDVPTDHLIIKHYLTDQTKALTQLIEDHHRLAIRAPTGSGKTTFLVKYAKRNKARMVIAMPTVNLAEQTARGTGGFVLTGDRNTAKIRAAIDKNLVVCTYDTLHQVADLWRRILVIDEAHNLINQYGRVYNGYKPFRAETLRNCVRRFPEAQKTILLSGTMPPLLCHAFDFHLVTFRRLENPTVRVFDVEAESSTPEALAKCLLTRLAEVFPPRAQRAATSPLPSAAVRGGAGGEVPRAQQASNSGSTNRPKDQQTNKLHVVFWNNTDQITRLKQTLVDLNYLSPDEIAIISRTHYNNGNAPDLDDIIRNQRINPRIRLLLCTCLISEGVNIKNTNVGRIYTVGLRCEDTFRQFIARFRKLKTVNVFSILEAERDLHPEFFLSGKIELLENLERARMQATHLRRRDRFYQRDYNEAELPYLDRIEESKYYHYQNQLLNLVYREDDWYADPLHVLAAIRGRKLATSNNCYFYTRLRAHNFSVFRVRQMATASLVNDTIDEQHQTAKAARKQFRQSLLEDLQRNAAVPLNALYLLYTEKSNRHGLGALRTLAPDLLDDREGTTGARYLSRHRAHFDDHTKGQILRFAKLYALGVREKEAFLSLTKADFHHEYQSALFHFEQLVADDPEHRKHLLPAHKEEIRIKQRMVTALTETARSGSPPDSEDSNQNLPYDYDDPPLTGEALLQRLTPLFTVPRPSNLPTRSGPKYPKKQRGFAANQTAPTPPAFSIIGLTPARAVNLVRRIMHVRITGTGRYRVVALGAPFTTTTPPPLAAVATALQAKPLSVLPLIGT